MPEMSTRRESEKFESQTSLFEQISQISSSSENRTRSGVRSFVAKLPTTRTQSFLIAANKKMDQDEMKISAEQNENKKEQHDSSWRKG